ncbi:MAG: heterodisulfide reductase subunit A-like protein [Spirochaetota bacterium]
MGKKGLILCVCQGNCPSFHKMDIFEVLNKVRREKLVDFVSLHPQLCAEDGDQYVKTLLANKDIENIYVAGCDPQMQKKMYKDAMNEAGFNPENHKGVDIRNMSTDEAFESIKKLITG